MAKNGYFVQCFKNKLLIFGQIVSKRNDPKMDILQNYIFAISTRNGHFWPIYLSII